MSRYKWLLDFGHGGMIKDHYVTAPRKMFKFPDGLAIYEGAVNRQIGYKVVDLLEADLIDHEVISDYVEDLSLQVRVQKADNSYTKDKRCIFVSIHSNAGGGSGFEIFTSKGQTKSDTIAQIFFQVYKKSFPQFKFRTDQKDGDDDKEEEFYVLRKTDCPAILIENLFFDNRKEAEFLLSENGQREIANCIHECIKTVERLTPI